MSFLLLLLALLGTLAAALGLVQYSPTQPTALMRNRVRETIMGLLHRQPGVSISEICRESQIAWGTAQHHLYLLQRAGLANSLPFGRNRVFFPSSVGDARRELLATLRSPRLRELGRAVLDSPGLLQKDLCARLGLTRKVFRQHIELLKSVDLVVEHVGAKVRRYEPTDRLRAEGRAFLDGAESSAPTSVAAGPGIPAFRT